jgi:hypothetical protein
MKDFTPYFRHVWSPDYWMIGLLPEISRWGIHIAIGLGPLHLYIGCTWGLP